MYAHVCVCVRRITDSVYSKSRGSFPIAKNTKRNTAGGLLERPSSHREGQRKDLHIGNRKGRVLSLSHAHAHMHTHTQVKTPPLD